MDSVIEPMKNYVLYIGPVSINIVVSRALCKDFMQLFEK